MRSFLPIKASSFQGIRPTTLYPILKSGTKKVYVRTTHKFKHSLTFKRNLLVILPPKAILQMNKSFPAILLFLLLVCHSLYAQEQDSVVLPVFPGGDSALYSFIKENVQYSGIAVENGITGVIRFSIHIDSIGKIDGYELQEGENDPFLVKECERTIGLIPPFMAGSLNGKPSSFDANLFFDFSLSYEKQNDGMYMVNESIVPTFRVTIPKDVYTVVETMPQYPGGDMGMLTFIARNVEYPTFAKENGLTGVVYVSYIVDRDGSIKDVKVLRGVHKSLNEEAMRVVRQLNGYKPGLQDGKPVPVQFTVPIRFELQGAPTPDLQFVSSRYRAQLPPYLDSANKALGRHDFQKAIELYTKSIETENDLGEAYFERAIAHYALRDIENAEADFEDAIKNTKHVPDNLYMTRADMRTENGNLDGAIADYMRVLTHNNNSYTVNLLLGKCWLEKGEFKTAKKYLRVANSARPNNPDGHFYLGVLEITKGEFNKAIESFDRLLELYPEHGNGYFNRGMAKARLQDVDAACEDWIKAKNLGVKEAEPLVQNQCSGK